MGAAVRITRALFVTWVSCVALARAADDVTSTTAARLEELAKSSGGESHAALLRELVAGPIEPVRAWIAGVAKEPTEARCRAALEVLAEIGTAADLELVLVVARAGGGDGLAACVTAITKRDPHALQTLDDLVGSQGPDAQLAIVQAVDAYGTTAAIRMLARWSERHSAVRVEAIARIGRQAAVLGTRFPDEVDAAVRGALGSGRADVESAAIVACGRMKSSDAIAQLVPLLHADAAGVRSDAAWALQRITGLTFRERADLWERWYAAELAWWDEDAPNVADALVRGADHAKVEALHALAQRRTWPERAVALASVALEDRSSSIATLAVATLREIGNVAACRALLDATDDPRAVVACAAWSALEAITHRELPRERAVWAALIEN